MDHMQELTKLSLTSNHGQIGIQKQLGQRLVGGNAAAPAGGHGGADATSGASDAGDAGGHGGDADATSGASN